jgi:hypothetical protein
VNPLEKIEWLAPEYEHREQSVDWFWALGIIIFAVAVTSVIYKNYFFAILIILGGILLAHFTIKKPEMVDYELTEEGLKIKNTIYPYKKIKHFWVQTDPTPMLFIHSDKLFMPIITMPIYPNMAVKIREKFIAMNVAEIEMKDHPSVKVMEFLGF